MNNEDFLSQYNRALIENDAAFFETLKRLWDITDESCIPAIVTEYNKDENRVMVLPLAKNTSETAHGYIDFDRPIVEVPIYQLMHGGFRIHCPIFRGDTGYLIACDRMCDGAIKKNSNRVDKPQEDISEDAEGNNGATRPDDFRLKEFSNGFFLPCSWVKPELGEKLFGKLVIGSIGSKEKADAYITLDDGEIELHADHSIKVVAPEMIIGDGERKVEINPTRDLNKTDAKFREVSMVTGYKKDPDDEKKIKLLTKKVRVLADESEDGESIEFETGGGITLDKELKVNDEKVADIAASDNINIKVPKIDKSFKVNNTEVAKIASSSDININLPHGANQNELKILVEIFYDNTEHIIKGTFLNIEIVDGIVKSIGSTYSEDLIFAYEETTY